jgi:oligosaccharyltransferase complex subunit beta
MVATLSTVNAVNKRTLVLIDNPQIRTTHSAFFAALQGDGHDLSYVSPLDESTPLQKYGEFFFENLIIFAPSTEDFGEGIGGTEGIISFIDSGRNVLIGVNQNVSEPIREIANLCGVDFDESETSVIDHVNYANGVDNGDHTVIATTHVLNSNVMLGKGPSSPVLYSGIGHAYSGANANSSPLLYRVLTGSSSTYSHFPNQRVKTYPQSTGVDTLLVTAIQTRNNARIVLSGSIDLFSNKYFASPVDMAGKIYSKSGNEDFALELSKWNFQGRGLLRASSLSHRLSDRSGPINPLTYRVKDQIEFSVLIEEYNTNTQSWGPFIADDVLLEFVMIDPYIRTALKHDFKGHFTTKFQVPDVYGVYKFVLHYQKLGYTFLDLTHQVSVHPFRHHEFERFIDVAFPYYASAFSMMVAFFLFGFVFLYQKDKTA